MIHCRAQRTKVLSADAMFLLTKLRIPIVIIASDSLLEVAQADCQVARSAQVNNEVAPAFARRFCMVIVLIICSLHLRNIYLVSVRACLPWILDCEQATPIVQTSCCCD